MPFPNDTDREIQNRLDDAYRAMTPQQKVARMAALTELTHSLALARIREQYPDETERHHRIRLCARWLDTDQVRPAFGWAPGDAIRGDDLGNRAARDTVEGGQGP